MSQAPAYAPVIHAASGLEDATMRYQNDASRPPNNGIFVADVLGAIHAASAIQTALFDRERTGLGQSIDVALMDGVLGMLIYELQVAQHPVDRQRQVYQPVRAADGFVMVAAVTARNLASLFEVIGYPEGKTDPRFATVREKESNWSALLELIERWTLQRSALECEQTLMAAGVPCSRYRTVGEAMNDAQSTARGLMTRLGTDDEPFAVANLPYRMSASDTRARSTLPHLGEHTDAVLSEVLGYDAQRLAGMRAAGAFGRTTA